MNLIQHYMKYVENTEPMYIYHRWVLFSMVGAMLGRRVHFQFGHFKIHPNIYNMLIGEPGARKSTAILIGKKLAKLAGYETDHAKFAATKTSKERFLLDFEGLSEQEQQHMSGTRTKGRAVAADLQDFAEISANLFGEEYISNEPKECYVCADEFNEFIGIRNIEFISMLGTLWDWDDETKPFESRIKTGRSARVWQPTLSILGGNTHENFNTAFPPEILGQGFFSRLLLVYGARSDRKFTIPPIPTEAETASIVSHIASIRNFRGMVSSTSEAFTVLDAIYNGWKDLPDTRFLSYSNRRFAHLLKLCIIVAALTNEKTNDGNLQITEAGVIAANTYLTAAEILMPKALGEFGRGKHSAVINKITDVMKARDSPITASDLWKEVRRDLNKFADLVDILVGMQQANVIFHIAGVGYMLKGQQQAEFLFVDWDLLTEEERKMIS